MIDLTKYKNSRYLKASDLTAPRARVKIHGVAEEPIGTPPENRIVVTFSTPKLKPLVCRYTKLEALVTGLGPDETTWVGKIIDLVKVKVPLQGKLVDSIAIEVPVQPDASAPVPAASDHEDLT